MAWDTFLLVLKIFWRRIGLLLLANVLWLIMSLLVVTWPAATAGLFYLARRVADEELLADPEPAVIADFWRGFREQWRRSSILSFGNLALLALIGFSLRFYGEGAIESLSWLVGPITLIGAAWAGMQLYLYPLLIHRRERSPFAIMREAFLMTISYPLNTFLMLLTTLVLLAAATILAGPVLFIFFSLIAIMQTIGLRTILAQRGELVLRMTPEQREAREHTRQR
jgi:uncharacterized membrane protein YesL